MVRVSPGVYPFELVGEAWDEAVAADLDRRVLGAAAGELLAIDPAYVVDHDGLALGDAAIT